MDIVGYSDEVKKCPKCSQSMPADNRFCAVCGHDTTAVQERKADEQFVACSDCGLKFSKDAKFCPECKNT